MTASVSNRSPHGNLGLHGRIPPVWTRHLDHIDPDLLVSAVPYLLGFIPESSLVLIGLADGSTSPSSTTAIQVSATVRVDLPDVSGGTDADFLPWFISVLTEVARVSDAVVAISWGDEPVDEHVRCHDDLLQDLHGALEDAGLLVSDLLRVSGQRWRSVLCQRPACCPEGGRVVAHQGDLEAIYALAPGARIPLNSRAVIEAELQEEQPTYVWPLTPPRVPPGAVDATVKQALAVLQRPEDPDSDDAFVLSAALTDVRVRDTIIWEIATTRCVPWSSAIAVLTHVLHRAPDTYLPPLATLLGIAHWQTGDGVRAGIAIEIALRVDPGYSFAVLLDQCINAGISPKRWRDDLARIPRERCAGQGWTDHG